MALEPIINGSNGAVINKLQLRFNPFEGGEYGGTYEGPDAAIFPMNQILFNLGYSVDYLKDKSAISTLAYSATFTAVNGGIATNPNSDYQDTWELVRNTVQKEILESDHPLVYALVPDNLSQLQSVISNPNKIFDGATITASNIEDAFTDTGVTKPGSPISSIDAAIYLFTLYLSGVKTVEVKQPILRLTRTTNPLYDAPFNTSNIDTILTTSSMISDSGVPSNFAVPLASLATNLMAKAFPNGIPNPPVQVRSDALILEFAWLKDLVSSTKHGSKRIQFVLEYRFGLFDTKLYGFAS